MAKQTPLQRTVNVEESDCGFTGIFHAMASPCEVLIGSNDIALAKTLTEIAANEAWRIEQKFSRYRDDNLVYQINHSQGSAVSIDDETARLFSFADQSYRLSNGAFDITSGILRKIWIFNGGDNIPSRKQAKQLLKHIGWSKVIWNASSITLPAGMEIDLGGIGKEYAVDRSAALIDAETDCPYLLNYGGDLFANKPPDGMPHWSVGVERIGGKASAMVQLSKGGLATSGDANRYLLRNGIRYSHVLNPRTGWPVLKAPSSVSVVSNTCVEAGILATMAMLRGSEAETFLKAQEVPYWIQQ